ncbi:hypothetical protein [Yinghuangia soli]|uniref:Uncharacterized protein n=1 Tax=Yinghuangia soli TaxID=2908204 RepID=A0AA41Q530_9ACTN|nr:hypothetical protein [Yinghuangia soli]MCF2531730.1 hypothetical protein [Yinghuangia soli]
MTDTDTLRAAAARLRNLARDATTDGAAPWRYRDRTPTTGTLLYADRGHPIIRGGSTGRGDGPRVHRATGIWIATLDPTLGLLIAAWLDHDADTGHPSEAALHVARAVLDDSHINPETTR